jgi:hypothetical protein
MKRPDIEGIMATESVRLPSIYTINLLCAYTLALEADHRAMREALVGIRENRIEDEGICPYINNECDCSQCLASRTLANLRVKDIPAQPEADPPLAEERKTNDSE